MYAFHNYKPFDNPGSIEEKLLEQSEDKQRKLKRIWSDVVVEIKRKEVKAFKISI